MFSILSSLRRPPVRPALFALSIPSNVHLNGRRPSRWQRTILGAMISGGLLITVRPGDAALTAQANEPHTLSQQTSRITHLPISFVKNVGQASGRVAYLAQGSGSALFLTSSEAVLRFASPAGRATRRGSGGALHFRYLHANPHPRIVGLDRLPGIENFFIGNDPARWHTNVPTYARVKYQDVYPGIDLVYYSLNGQVEYDWIVRAGADVGRIGLGIDGARQLRLDRQGRLVIRTDMGEVVQQQPLIYQQVAGIRVRVGGGYRWDGSRGLAIRLGHYDRRQALVIDPTVPYSTYLGGNNYSTGSGIAVDGAGDTYVTGSTSSTSFPTTATTPASYGGGPLDAFVTKVNASGSALLYSTYLGGSGSDQGNGIAVDRDGNAYITGTTSSTDFPTVAPFQASNGANGGSGNTNDAFVTKISSSGKALLYSSYLGGNSADHGNAIALDSAGNAYVTGDTQSLNFPKAASFQGSRGGSSMNSINTDAFVTKINPAGSALLYSSYLGGSGDDYGRGIAVGSTGDAYVTGETNSIDFPTTAPFQASERGYNNAFVTKINPVGSALLYSSYLGGSGDDYGRGIAVDGQGNAYVTGRTLSADFPTVAPFQASKGSDYSSGDAFVTKINDSGSAVVYSSYLGGSNDDEAFGIAVDNAGNAYVTGRTGSTNFPTTVPFQSSKGGNQYTYDAFVTEVNASGSALKYSSYLGGNGDDVGYGIAVDTVGEAYVTGSTGSNNFPTAAPFQGGIGTGIYDAFITKIQGDGTASQTGASDGQRATASVGGTGPYQTGSYTSTAFGSTGSVTVAQYAGNPVTGSAPPSGRNYFDVKISAGNTFSSVQIVDCNLGGGNTLYWYDGSMWQVASPVSVNTPSSGCATLTVGGASSPNLSQLTGTIFASGANSNPTSARVIGLRVVRHLGGVVIRWHAVLNGHLVGFNLYAGGHLLNHRLIRVHAGTAYRYVVHARVDGRVVLMGMLTDGHTVALAHS